MKGTLMVLAALASQVLALPQNQGGGAEIKPKEPPPLSLVAHSTDTSKQKLELSFILYMGPEIASADVGYCEMAGANNKKSIESVQANCADTDKRPIPYKIQVQNYKDSGNFDVVVTYTGDSATSKASGAVKSLPVQLRANVDWTCLPNAGGYQQLCMNAPENRDSSTLPQSIPDTGKPIFGRVQPVPVNFP